MATDTLATQGAKGISSHGIRWVQYGYFCLFLVWMSQIQWMLKNDVKYLFE